MEIAAYLTSAASSRFARRIIKEILGRLDEVRRFPDSGTPRDHVRPGLRAVIKHHYVAYYAVRDRAIVVVTVVHGSRDVDVILDESNET